MNLSGIVVVAGPGRLDAVVARLQALAGVEVRQTDPSSGRAVVVQEAATVEDEVAGLARIKALPGVVAAEMVYHYFAEDPALARASAAVPSPPPAID
jgi:nitrate reductase NapD